MSYYGITFTLMLGVAIGTAIYCFFKQSDINQPYQHQPEPHSEYRRRRRRSSSEENVQEDCIICFSKLSSSKDIRYLICGHSFHEACIRKWLNTSKTCPVCRESVN